jgi:hypothetical protein
VDRKVAKMMDATAADALSRPHLKLTEEENSLKGSKWMKPEVWMRHFDELVKFKSIHGHCRVPGRTKPLGGWVKVSYHIHSLSFLFDINVISVTEILKARLLL